MTYIDYKSVVPKAVIGLVILLIFGSGDNYQ